MTSKRVFVSYDHEGDMLEVLWALREGYFTPTDDGEVIGFLIHEMSTLKEPSPVEFELASEPPADDVANVTVREADRPPPGGEIRPDPVFKHTPGSRIELS